MIRNPLGKSPSHFFGTTSDIFINPKSTNIKFFLITKVQSDNSLTQFRTCKVTLIISLSYTTYADNQMKSSRSVCQLTGFTVFWLEGFPLIIYQFSNRPFSHYLIIIMILLLIIIIIIINNQCHVSELCFFSPYMELLIAWLING